MKIEGFTIVTKKGKLLDSAGAAGYFTAVKKRLVSETYAKFGQRVVPAVLEIDDEDLAK
jgi:hypothetical protein